MLTAVLDRMPDYRCNPETTVHYDTIRVIQGMRHLPATFKPAARRGAGIEKHSRGYNASATNKDSPDRSRS